MRKFLKHPLLYITLLAFLLRILFFRVNETFISSDEVYLFQNSLKPLTFLLDITPEHYAAELFRFFNFNWGWATLAISTVNAFILHVLRIPVTEISINLPYVFLGTLTIPLIYILGKELKNKRVGLIAALLFAIQPAHVSTSRSIGLIGIVATFFFCLTTLLFIKYFRYKKFKKIAFFSLGIYFAADLQFYLILPLILYLGNISIRASFCEKLQKLIKEMFSPSLLFFLLPIIPIITSSAYLYLKQSSYNSYLFHAFLKPSYGGIFISTTFKELFQIVGPALAILSIAATIFAIIHLWHSTLNTPHKILIIWLTISITPWFFIVNRTNTSAIVYLIHPITALIFLVALFIDELYKISKKISVLTLTITILMTVLVTSSVVYGINPFELSEVKELPLYQLVDTPAGQAYTHFGSKGTNTGIKTAGYYIRENTPAEAIVFSDHELFVTEFYTGRKTKGFLDLSIEKDIIKQFRDNEGNKKIDYIYVQEKHQEFIQVLMEEKYAPEVFVYEQEKLLGRIFNKNVTKTSVLQVKKVDPLFDRTYGNIQSLFIDYT